MKKRISIIFLTFLFILTLSILLTACVSDSEGKHTVSFDTNGGSVVASQTVKDGERIQKPDDPIKDGYKFWGWYKPNGDRWSFVMEVDSDVTLIAKWKPVAYKINYHLNGGINAEENPIEYVAGQDVVLYPAKNPGYKFDGWYDTSDFSGEKIEYIDGSQKKNIQLYAKWSGSGLVYTLSSDGSYAILEAYKGMESVVVVDKIYQGVLVTEIADKVFARKSTITQISVPSSVKKIGVGAFSECPKLKIVDLPQRLNVISNDLFSGCTNLSSMEIPASVTEIGDNAFSGCRSIKQITIPQAVTKIGDNAFKFCSEITKLEIPSSVTSLGVGAFSGCSKLQSVNIPSGITELKDNLFEGCASIVKLEIPSSVKNFGDAVFSGCAMLEGVTIPSSQTRIGNQLFSGCKAITEIEIPSSVTYLGFSAFANCSRLKKVNIPTAIKEINDNLFYNCSRLESVTIVDGVTEIGYNAFYGCSSLTKLEIPDTVKKIGDYAFGNCDGLKDMFISSYVDQIGRNVLLGSDNLKSLTLPYLGGGEGSDGSEDLKYTFGSNIPESLEKVTINGGKVSGKPFTGADNIKEVYFGASVEFGSGAIFYECKSLTKVSGFNGSEISNLMFYNCVSLKNFVISKSVTSIGYKAFKNCTALEQIVIGENVTYIGANVFEDCSSLSIKCRADALPSTWNVDWNISNCPVEWGY